MSFENEAYILLLLQQYNFFLKIQVVPQYPQEPLNQGGAVFARTHHPISQAILGSVYPGHPERRKTRIKPKQKKTNNHPKIAS
jgi:hypothetical protein